MSNLRADEGHRPLREGNDFAIQPGLFQVSEGLPSSVPGCARSTLSGGEGDLPAGASYTRTKRKGQRRKSLAQKALWDRLLGESSGAGTGDAAKDHKVGNGGAAQTVGAVDASGDLTGSEQAGDDGAIFLQHFG